MKLSTSARGRRAIGERAACASSFSRRSARYGQLGAQHRAIALEQHERARALDPVDHLGAVGNALGGGLRERVVAGRRERRDGRLDHVVVVARGHGGSPRAPEQSSSGRLRAAGSKRGVRPARCRPWGQVVAVRRGSLLLRSDPILRMQKTTEIAAGGVLFRRGPQRARGRGRRAARSPHRRAHAAPAQGQDASAARRSSRPRCARCSKKPDSRGGSWLRSVAWSTRTATRARPWRRPCISS